MKKFNCLVYPTLVLSLVFSACGQTGNKSANAGGIKDTTTSMQAMAYTTHKYTLAMVVNKKDPSCGMPLTAGLEDTTHYKGKAYGFCSKECKNEFLKNPDGYIAKMK